MIRFLPIVVLATALLGASAARAEGVITRASAHGADETLTRLVAAIEAKGLAVIATIDHAAGAAKAGLVLPPTTLVVFGDPKVGTPLIEASPTAGLDLPLKALVYQAADGTVAVAANDPAYLAARHGITGQDERIARMAAAIDALLTAATE